MGLSTRGPTIYPYPQQGIPHPQPWAQVFPGTGAGEVIITHGLPVLTTTQDVPVVVGKFFVKVTLDGGLKPAQGCI